MRYSIGKIVCIAAFFLTGCGNLALNHIPYQPTPMQKKLAVFLDGTANAEGSHTNISKLHNLVRLQPDIRISATYIKGVGVDGKIIGMAMGWGIGQDVRQAYRYLAENYRHELDDEIYIFGFSRGAYAARILAALIHVAGIPDISGIKDKKERIRYIEAIYDQYKSNGEKTIIARRESVRLVIKPPYKAVSIKFMGLWDTVEALGLPNFEENIDVPNPRYADQLCNVKRVAHAVSIDDNRADIFTPLLLTRKHLIKECVDTDINNKDADLNEVVTEVWFSGAHSDVGGGYNDTEISGVSLNWMIGEINDAEKTEKRHLLPSGAAVYSDFAGKTHDPEAGIWKPIYNNKHRALANYMPDSTNYKGKPLKLHQSVIDRMEKCKTAKHDSKWFEKSPYKVCFPGEGPRYKFNETNTECKKLIKIVDQKYIDIIDQQYKEPGAPKCGNDKDDPEKE